MFNTDTIADCMKASFANTPFPEVVARLAGAGVRSYTADLVKVRKTYYGAVSDGHDEAMPLEQAPAIAPAFELCRRRRDGQSHPARRNRLCGVPEPDHGGRLRAL